MGLKDLFQKNQQSQEEIDRVKSKITSRKASQEKKLEKIRAQKDQIKQEARNVAENDEIKLKEYARKHAMLQNQEKMLSNQVAMLGKTQTAIESKEFLNEQKDMMDEISEHLGGLGIDQSELEDLMSEIGYRSDQAQEAVESMGEMIEGMSGEDEDLSESEDAFMQEIMAEKEAKDMGVKGLEQEIYSEKEEENT